MTRLPNHTESDDVNDVCLSVCHVAELLMYTTGSFSRVDDDDAAAVIDWADISSLVVIVTVVMVIEPPPLKPICH